MSGPARRPLRFCMVTTFYPPFSFGGDGIFVERLSRELADRGHSVDVVHNIEAFRALGGNREVEASPAHPNIRTHGLRSPAGALWPLLMHQTGQPVLHSAELKRRLGSGYDVIHYHNVSLMGGPEILTFGHAVKLYTMHEYWLVCPTHVLFKNGREACEQPECLRCTLAHRRPPQWWRYTGKLRAAAAHVDAFLALSRFSLDIHRARGFEGDLRLLPSFVPRLASPPTPRLSGGTPYFLFVGRLERLKGLHTLIPAFKRGFPAELRIAGAGGMEAELRTMARDNPRIRFLGRLGAAELDALYRDAVALVVPSLCYEASPLVVMEAFRQGTPAIVRRIGGLSEAVEPPAAGYAYDSQTELATAMRSLLERPDLREEMGNRAAEVFETRFTPEVHLENYMRLIDEFAAGRA